MKKSKEMNNCWWINEFLRWNLVVFIWIFHLNAIFCLSLNHEGNALLKFKERVVNDPFGALSSWEDKNGEANPSSWFGVGCAGGHVISLNLKNMCLEGTLAPELQQLLHIKSIILRNNSFYGFIPEEFRNLKELQLLDLGVNNFDALPPRFGWNISNFLLDNTGLSCHTSVEMEEQMMLPEVHNDHSANFVSFTWSRFISQVMKSYILPLRHIDWAVNDKHPRRLLQEGSVKEPTKSSTNPNTHPPPTQTPTSSHPPPASNPHVVPSPNGSHIPAAQPSSAGNGNRNVVIGVVGGAIGLILVIGLLLLCLFKSKKIRKATGLSGQLQKAFVAGNVRSDGFQNDNPSFVEGIPNLKRSELVSACEDFSNVIGSSSLGTIYKGTLSNGVEIAVITLSGTSAKDWSKNLEAQFRIKIESLSKVHHKNFVNLIGYCEEEDPFTRLMVFEYAPNGSLFEHLHVREAEHLDWRMRLRVAMGISYCLEQMHQLKPPVIHPNLNSSAVSLSEDYAAKISEFCFWNEVAARQVQPMVTNSLSSAPLTPEGNVLTFGLVLLEMMTGRIPHSMENNSLDDWVLEYMRGELPLQDMVDPMLRHFDSEQLDKIGEVIRKCLHSEQNRPTMRDVTTRLKEVTGINQDKAAPRFSSVWWAELETRSANGT